ncbi:DUF4124 domain-containing protein [Pseudoalteromonas sp. PS5]|uniref:DUF4124 domain-containing protein n=1 Tax=Pseudoalteromonas sp. PS5 TaxID=1437473 RepID=UPI000FFF348F|nr:DUF4124 domain-containing protein [Pseudoalteromonas sp. PS5]RXF04457.1 DUF4124 domain-containing protein [Pseudoalteromonas sp. PS5]
MKMKAASYLMIMVMLVAVACLFVLKRPDGKPWLSVQSITQSVEHNANELKRQGIDAMDQVKSYTNDLLGDSKPASSSHTQVYRWQDAKGQWHYSDKPNPHGHSQAYQIDESKITVIAAEDTSILAAKAEQEPNNSSSKAVPTALNPAAVQQLMKDTQDVQKLMDERAKKIDEALKENR